MTLASPDNGLNCIIGRSSISIEDGNTSGILAGGFVFKKSSLRISNKASCWLYNLVIGLLITSVNKGSLTPI